MQNLCKFEPGSKPDNRLLSIDIDMKINTIIATILLLIIAGCFGNGKNQGNTLYNPEKIDSKGTLVIVGGGDSVMPVIEHIVELGGGDRAKVLVVPFASGFPEEMGLAQVQEFLDAGCEATELILCEKEEIDSPENIAKLDSVTVVFFGGGDQNRLTSFLAGTKFLERIRSFYNEGGVVGGTSAGAAVMSKVMITGNQKSNESESPPFDKIEKGDIVTAEGFGFLKNIIIDQHFIIRKRENRLFSVLLDYPNMRGIGIDEPAAIVVKPDNTFEVIGTGQVLVFEPYSDNVEAENFNTYKVRILSPGDTYNL